MSDDDRAARYEAACYLLETSHREDPRPGPAGAETWSSHYHERLAARLDALAPDAPEAARLAARGRLIRGWFRRRQDFPPGPEGHERWVHEADAFHRGELVGLLGGLGYARADIEAVVALALGAASPDMPGAQAYDDAVGLTFFELELPELLAACAPDDVILAIRRVWRRMSAPARAEVTRAAAEWPEGPRAILAAATA